MREDKDSWNDAIKKFEKHEECSTDNDFLFYDLYDFFCLMSKTIKEEFIIVKHDIQHLNFICANLSNNESERGSETPDFTALKGISENLIHLVDKLQDKFKENIRDLKIEYIKDKEYNEETGAYRFTHKFNTLRLAYMKSLSMLSKELDYLHKTIAESCYSLPPMIDPVRRYKRKIDKDELVVLSRIVKSYNKKFESILKMFGDIPKENKPDSSQKGPFIYIDYSASTKLFANPVEEIKEIAGIKSEDSPDKYNGFVKLPYWAVKMSEYTSGVAHELVHLYLHSIKKTNKNSGSNLLEYIECLAEEIRNVLQDFDFAKEDKDSIIGSIYGGKLSEEIIADIMSLFIAGPSYYFSLFMQGTARYAENEFFSKSVLFLYARILILEAIVEGILKSNGALFSEKDIDRIERLESRIVSPKNSSRRDKEIKNLKRSLKIPPRVEVAAEKTGLEFIDEIENDKYYILSKMLIKSRKYIEYIIEDIRILAQYGGDNNSNYNENSLDFYNFLYFKYLIQQDVAERIAEIFKKVLIKEERDNVKRQISKMNEIDYEKFELMDEEMPCNIIGARANLELDTSVNLLNIPGRVQVQDVLKNVLEKSELPENNVISNNAMLFKLINSGNNGGDSATESENNFDYSIIPEYLWEIALTYFSKCTWKLRRKTIESQSESITTAETYYPNKRLLKLTIARLLGVDIRRKLFLDNESAQLKLGEIEEWLFAKVDWVKSYKRYENANNRVKLFNKDEGIVQLVQKDISSQIRKIELNKSIYRLSEIKKEIERLNSKQYTKGVPEQLKKIENLLIELSKFKEQTMSKSDGIENPIEEAIPQIESTEEFFRQQEEKFKIISDKINKFKNEIRQINEESYADFILGDYDFLIRLPGASTRRDINWPPVKTDKNGNLLTCYSYREYIVEKVILDGKEQEESENKSKKPYLLQFIRFEESSDKKNKINDIIVKLLRSKYEVYLSNSWNEIFIKKYIEDPINNSVDEIISEYKNIVKKVCKNNQNINNIIKDVQSYFVFPKSTFNENNKNNENKNNNCIIMRTILKTTGIVENSIKDANDNETSIIETALKNKRNILQDIKKINFTLGIMDYIIDWKPIKSLNKAKDLAIDLINTLVSFTRNNDKEDNGQKNSKQEKKKQEFKSLSTLTSIVAKENCYDYCTKLNEDIRKTNNALINMEKNDTKGNKINKIKMLEIANKINILLYKIARKTKCCNECLEKRN